MKIAFIGTSEFAIPALASLRQSSRFEIIGVVTQPDKPAGRKKTLQPSPVKLYATQNQLPVLQPDKLSMSDAEKLSEAELFIVASYGQLIPKNVLDIPRLGALNIHPSLLPKYRGPSPVQSAILNGDVETGVTIIKLDDKMDHGPILASQKMGIQNPRIFFEKLYDELAKLGADLLLETLPKYIKGEIAPTPQDHDKATFTKIINKNDARINWSDATALKIDQMVRAYHRWPVAWTTISIPSPDEGRDRQFKRLKIFNSTPLPSTTTAPKPPGNIVVEDQKIIVFCKEKTCLRIDELQIEGGQKMFTADFIHGFQNLTGKTLI